jgi:hypothetical protein
VEWGLLMALDTGIYNALMKPSRTAFEYQADFEKQDRDREQYGQQRQMNALAMQQRQGQIGDESMARADAMGVRNVLASGGGAPELRKLGTPEAIKQADAAEQRGRETQLFGLKMDEAQNSTFSSKLDQYRQMVDTGAVRDPATAAQWLRAQYADPVIGPRLQQVAPIEQAISNIGQTPEAFADWSRRTVMGMQGMAKAEAEAEARRTAAMRAEMERKRYEFEVLRSGRKDAREDVKLGFDAEALQIKRDALAKDAAKQDRETQKVRLETKTALDAATEGLALIDQARTALKSVTGGMVQKGLDIATNATGVATENSKLNAKLKVLAGALTSKVDKQPGATSDADLKMYKEMAADVGNEGLPAESRLAALQTAEEIQRRMVERTKARIDELGPVPAPAPARAQQPAPRQAQRQQSAPVMTRTEAEYNALPSGTAYIGPDGKTRMKP